MKTIEQEKRGIKRIIRIQFIAIALIIIPGGIFYGLNTERLFSAFGTTITFLVLVSPFVPLTYMAALNRLEKYSDSYSSEMPKPMSSIPLKATRLPNGFETVDELRYEEINQANPCATVG